MNEFFKTLYGGFGDGFVSVNWKNRYFKSKWFSMKELPQMAAWAERVGGKYETYFSVNPRKSHLEGAKRGGLSDIYAVGCVYVDLDIKGPAHAEESLPEEGELTEFISAVPLAPSIIVHSGNGMHLYWVLDQPVSVDKGELLSRDWEKFVKDKAYTEHGWKFDSVSDLPRMLRVPGTINHKTEPYTECRVIRMTEKRYRLSDFGPFAAVSKNNTAEDTDDLSLLGTGRSKDIISNCAFIRHCRDDAATLPEPQWYAAVSNLALTFDGEKAVHEISSPYPKYSYAETEGKYKHAASEEKPVTCEYIHTRFNFDCGKNCKENGIKCPVGWAHPHSASSHIAENEKWQLPIPFHTATGIPFPVDALPDPYASFARAVSESTQTPADMAAVSILSIMAACLQHKYVVQVKPDWKEPLNLYCVVIAPPSERKSAVLRHVIRPLDLYEIGYNQNHSAEFEYSRARKRVLERQLKFTEDNASKGKATAEELHRASEEYASYEEQKPLRLYVDDITTEKLASILSENKGHASLISSEGGIFDLMAGIYTKNVNIDVFLKAYSGDTIRVDRVGRTNEVIVNPALTILLMVQPEVISAVLSNKVFRGRGLTARFLYSAPESFVGRRNFNSLSIDAALEGDYQKAVTDLLTDEYCGEPEVITVSEEAGRLIGDFASEIESRIGNEYKDIAHWVGKLAGNTVRIAGLLCRAETTIDRGLFAVNDLEIDAATMADAIAIGRYFLSHAISCFDALPEDAMTQNAERVLETIRKYQWKEFDRRELMRKCRRFTTVESVQPVLDFMEDYGYIAGKVAKASKTGRPPLPRYAVNPLVLKADFSTLEKKNAE